MRVAFALSQLFVASDASLPPLLLKDAPLPAPGPVPVEKKCVTDKCWTYNADEDRCEMKTTEECSKLACSWDKMEIEVDSDLFGIENGQKDAFNSEAKPTYKDNGKWSLSCPLGACGMTAVSQVIDNVEYLGFSFPVFVESGSRQIDGMDVFITGKINAQVTYSCLYRSEVKVSSDEFSVISQQVSDKQTNYGTLEDGFEINLFTDEDMKNALTDTNVFVGQTIFVSVDWKVTSLSDLAMFYVDQCEVAFADKALAVVDRNCYSETFGAKLISEKVVSSSAKWQFQSFIVGRGQKTMEMKLSCNLKVCTKDEEKCERNISKTNDQCPNKAQFSYLAN